MLRTVISGLIFTLTLIISGTASAWLHFEPGIGYNKGQEQSITVQGVGLSVKLGVDFKDIFVVADIDYNDLQQGTQSSVKYTNTGLTLGGNFQKVRVWYGMITSAQYSYPSGTATATSKGTGSKIGIGAEISGKMNLNLELRSLNYTMSDSGSGAATPITETATIGFLSLSWIL